MPGPGSPIHWTEPPPQAPISPLPDLPPLVAVMLIRRGISTPEEARGFLDPAAYSPAAAGELPGMDAAVARLTSAIRHHEPICVWGDFDIDGQTATAILISALRSVGGAVSYHVPGRASEGHGIGLGHLKDVLDDGARLILTCDTGITADAAVDYATSRGVDVIVTDHHDLGEALPRAAAVVNPKMLPEGHPLADLAGAGVAYKLAEAMVGADATGLLDLAVLGLIGDLAILRADTRYLVQRGLEALRHTKRTGLRAMMQMAQVTPESLSEEHVGFELAPRLNAIGRLGDANPAVELLLTSEPGRARVIATELEAYNAQRKLISEQVYRAAEAQLRDEPALLSQPVIMLAHPTWHGGVIGLAASRMARNYGKPAILFTVGGDGVAHGSARSIEGLNITEAIRAESSLLRNFGGHPMAAGLSLDAAKLPQLRREMNQTVRRMLVEAKIEEATLQIDGWLQLPEITLELARQIGTLAPFGPGNERPVLATRSVTLRSATTIGRSDEHLRLTVEDNAGNKQAVLWWDGAGESLPEGTFDIAYTLRKNDFRGAEQVAAELVEWRLAKSKVVEVKRKLDVIDWRGERNKEGKLKEFLAENSSGTLIWAEGVDKAMVSGLGRQELTPAANLVIWTTPPSQRQLSEALDRAQPRTVVLMGVSQPRVTAKTFLERLAGLVKFSIEHKNGHTSLDDLAAATAQRETTIRLGLEWLQARGEISCESKPKGRIRLAPAHAEADIQACEQIRALIQEALDETASYRTYFGRAQNPVE